MTIQVVTVSTEELKDVICDAYKEGYLKAQREWVIEKASQKQEPRFGEIIRGVKELRQYLIYKDYWNGSISTLSKVAPQLTAEGDRQGHGLIFRRTYIDHSFEKGFCFQKPKRKFQKREPTV